MANKKAVPTEMAFGPDWYDFFSLIVLLSCFSPTGSEPSLILITMGVLIQHPRPIP